MTPFITWARHLALGLLTASGTTAYASPLEAQRDGLELLVKAATAFCSDVPTQGGVKSKELSASGKLELDNLLKKVVEADSGAEAKYQSEEWNGVLQQDLVAAMRNADTCRLRVMQELKASLIPSISISPPRISPPIKSTVYSVSVSDDELLIQVINPPSGEPSLKINGTDIQLPFTSLQRLGDEEAFYTPTGSLRELHLNVGDNDLTVKYPGHETLTTQFNMSESQRDDSDRAFAWRLHVKSRQR